MGSPEQEKESTKDHHGEHEGEPMHAAGRTFDVTPQPDSFEDKADA
jgi:hypothetical protein